MSQPFDNRDWDVLQIQEKEAEINRLKENIESWKGAYVVAATDRDIASAQCRKAGKQITELEEIICQKDELLKRAIKALDAADHCFGVILNAPGNTLNPHEMHSVAFETHSLVRCVIQEIREWINDEGRSS